MLISIYTLYIYTHTYTHTYIHTYTPMYIKLLYRLLLHSYYISPAPYYISNAPPNSLHNQLKDETHDDDTVFYDLFSTVAHIFDPSKNNDAGHLVTHIKVSATTRPPTPPLRYNGFIFINIISYTKLSFYGIENLGRWCLIYNIIIIIFYKFDY